MDPDRPWLVLVESNTTGSGRRFCAVARERCLRPVVLARDPERYPYLVLDGIDVRTVDTTSITAVLAACAELSGSGPLRGVTSSSEYFVATAASAAARLGLPGPDPEAIGRCRDKAWQRVVLDGLGVGVPRCVPVATPRDAGAAASHLGLPVIVKPRSGSGSDGVRLCRTVDEATEQAGRLFAAGDDRYAGVLVEEYVSGPEYSVELFDGRLVGTTAKYLGPEPSFVETGHDFPAPLARAEATALADTATRAVAALGLRVGPVHAEFRLTARGPVVIEVNPRLAGGMIPSLVELATGIDLIDWSVAAVCGDPARAVATRSAAASIRFVVAPRSGTVTRVDGVEHAGALAGVADAVVSARVGDRLTLRHDFRDRIGHVIATGADVLDSGSVAGTALECITVLVGDDADIPDGRTWTTPVAPRRGGRE